MFHEILIWNCIRVMHKLDMHKLVMSFISVFRLASQPIFDSPIAAYSPLHPVYWSLKGFFFRSSLFHYCLWHFKVFRYLYVSTSSQGGCKFMYQSNISRTSQDEFSGVVKSCKYIWKVAIFSTNFWFLNKNPIFTSFLKSFLSFKQ